MTREELKGYPYVVKLIERYERELAELHEDSAWGSSPDMTGIRTGGTGSKVESGYLRNEKKIQELTDKLNTYRMRLHKMDLFFSSIEDSQTLLIFELRFKQEYSWEQIAARIGGNNSKDTVKQTCYRYLKKSKQSNVYPDKSDTIIKTNKIKK